MGRANTNTGSTGGVSGNVSTVADLVNNGPNINVTPTNVFGDENNNTTQETTQPINVPHEIIIGSKTKLCNLNYMGNLSDLYGKTVANAANSIVFVKNNDAYTLWIVDENECIFPVQTYNINGASQQQSPSQSQQTPTNNTQPYYEQQNISESAQEMHI